MAINFFTFYAACDLPVKTRDKQAGFDWHAGMKLLAQTVRQHHDEKLLKVTDCATPMDDAALRVGYARYSGVMLWLLHAQAAAIAYSDADLVLVSPDTLLAGRVDFLFGDWDVCLLTRMRPKPIVNSVIGVRRSIKVEDWWADLVQRAKLLPAESQAWGADIDALVDATHVQPGENSTREVDGLCFRFMPIDNVFRSVPGAGAPQRLPVPIWDFKGYRKQRMADYARLL